MSGRRRTVPDSADMAWTPSVAAIPSDSLRRERDFDARAEYASVHHRVFVFVRCLPTWPCGTHIQPDLHAVRLGRVRRRRRRGQRRQPELGTALVINRRAGRVP